MINLLELIPRCHSASAANGWWEPRPNAGQQLMLVVSELSEALEADRNGRLNVTDKKLLAELVQDAKRPHSGFAVNFKTFVKDSPADELADAYIRLCDFAGGFELDLPLILIKKCDPEQWVIATDNFGDALLTCVQAVTGMHTVRLRTGFAPGHMEGPLADALTWVEALARQQGIDLALHIDLKLAYNATRGHKHGGKAY